LDVHYSSGVGNHFAYLLAEGSGAETINGVSYNSPTCDGSSVSGIGRDKLGKIWYRALTVYMTSSTKYAGARTATLSAAKDLYGAGSAEERAVAAAWSAVNVG
jgi:Zn-dependent metalloprotease